MLERGGMWSLPTNLIALHAVEEACRAEAVALIAESADLQSHVAFVEAAMSALVTFTQQGANDGEDEETMQLLGLRLLNHCAAAQKLLLSGYGQTSAMVMRDIMETGFLVAYLAGSPALITEWRNSDDRLRKKKFSARAVRVALDDRDGFKDQMRALHYGILCEMASHPAFKGFQLLHPEGQGIKAGPFIDRRIFSGLVDEMARVVVGAVPFLISFFLSGSKTEHNAKIAFMRATDAWMATHLARTPNRKILDDLELLVAQLPDDA